MKCGLFIHEVSSDAKVLYGAHFLGIYGFQHDNLDYSGKAHIYNEIGNKLADIDGTLSYGVSERYGSCYHFENKIQITTPFLITDCHDLNLVYKGHVSVDMLGKNIIPTYFRYCWLGVAGKDWYGVLRMQVNGLFMKKRAWYLYAYSHAKNTKSLLGFVSESIDHAEPYLRIDKLLYK